MRPQNVILIMADDLGYECIAANGGQSYHTPNIDAMGRRGVRFTLCFSQPLCTPSRVQIMTGKYNDKNYESFCYLPVGERTFGNLLRDHGYRHEHRIEYFRDAVEYTDFLVGNIVRRIDELGLTDNTLILFTGDNGTHPDVISQLQDVGEYPGGKGGMWIPGTHVPLFALYGNAACPGAVCDSLVDFSDFFPTIADVANLSLDRYTGLDGQSFLHHVTGTDGPERDWIYCHYVPGIKEDSKFETGRMVYDHSYKLYRSGAVYDMVNDIFERSPLADDDPVVAGIRSQYAPIFAGRPSWDGALARMKIVDPSARAGGNR